MWTRALDSFVINKIITNFLHERVNTTYVLNVIVTVRIGIHWKMILFSYIVSVIVLYLFYAWKYHRWFFDAKVHHSFRFLEYSFAGAHVRVQLANNKIRALSSGPAITNESFELQTKITPMLELPSRRKQTILVVHMKNKSIFVYFEFVIWDRRGACLRILSITFSLTRYFLNCMGPTWRPDGILAFEFP